jgi:hypothetical protein
MAPQNNLNSPTFVLHFPDAVRVAGETIQGRVELNVALAQDEGIENLHVNLKGSIVTYVLSFSRWYLLTISSRTIIESNFDGSETKHERAIEVRARLTKLTSFSNIFQLINSGKSLWERGTVFPDPGSHILVLPFKFKLPTNLPPSFHLSVLHHEAIISYTLEVVGSRPGLFSKDRLIRKIFPVLPAASPAQILAKKSMRKGWHGPWRTISLERKMRAGFWGDYSHASAEVRLHVLPAANRN